MVEFKQRLVGDMIVVHPEVRQASKILLPDWQRTLRGKVLGAGPGAPRPDGGCLPMSVKVGDYVIFGAAVGIESVYCGESIRLMREGDIDAIVDYGDLEEL
jgi:chaperonin GroES